MHQTWAGDLFKLNPGIGHDALIGIDSCEGAKGASLLSSGLFPGGLDGKEAFNNVGDLRLGRSSGEVNGNPLQNCCLEN